MRFCKSSCRVSLRFGLSVREKGALALAGEKHYIVGYSDSQQDVTAFDITAIKRVITPVCNCTLQRAVAVCYLASRISMSVDSALNGGQANHRIDQSSEILF